MLKTGKHTITALTRAGGNPNFPSGVRVVPIDYEDPDLSSAVEALRGQQVLIITLGVRAPQDLHGRLVAAAVKAGVPYIMPNCYGGDYTNSSLAKDSMIGPQFQERIAEVERSGCSYIVMVCGFWYEWSLAAGEQWYGFDIKGRKATLYDVGEHPINTSTLPQCGRALAALLSLPESGSSPSLADWKNKPLFLSSFHISQRDMLNSLERATNTTDADWSITQEPTDQRFRDGMAEMGKGDWMGFAKALYAQGFSPRGVAEFETRSGLHNSILGLPKEDLDVVTRDVVDRLCAGWDPFEG